MHYYTFPELCYEIWGILGVVLHVEFTEARSWLGHFTKYFVVPVSVMFVDIYCSFNYLRGRYILHMSQLSLTTQTYKG